MGNFTSVERKLAILNVTVVVAIVATIGIGTWIMLGRSLDSEADAALESRIQSSRETLTNLPDLIPIATVAPVSTGNSSASDDNDDSDDHEEDDHDRENREIVISGDTLVYVFDTDGHLVSNSRDVEIDHDHIPDVDGVKVALDGDIDTRFVTVEHERIRVRTEPVFYDGDVVGAIQAIRSEAEHDKELELVRNMTLIGTGIGVIVAVPAGIYLTRRAMAPINDMLHRQQAFVADAAHELRTPLTVLRASAELMARDQERSGPETRQELDQMIGDIDDMARMVDDLLRLSRAGTTDQLLELHDIDLRDVVDRSVQMLGSTASSHEVTLTSSGDHLRMHSNPDILGQVLRIVLENAIKYTPSGGTVEIGWLIHDDRAHITISDTGTGISAEDMPYVFDRFYRADKARARSGGSGLGLSIARGLVTALEGEIALASSPGRGTTVTLKLPVNTR